MVIVDRLTKRAKFVATQTTDSAEDTANVFMKNYVKDHGLPKTIVSDPFLKVAQDRMSEAQERMKYYYDRNRLVQDFKTGDMVLLDGKNLDIRHKGYAQSKKPKTSKLAPWCY
ncbi:Uncharacterized protein PHPALM_13096 [Phytophthora palmivora]|uniref:Uncharacterized protein n=1 Tax=Phytophthora palmivora TaxID=4796 RepID=A0A2P4XY22_9STRA|nr:Uncharacterized protein PHPALM_13096 [Phytophthora palmivora]